MNINSNDALMGDGNLPNNLKNGFVIFDHTNFVLRGYFFTIMGSFNNVFTLVVQTTDMKITPQTMEKEVCHSQLMDFEIGFMLGRMVCDKKYRIKETSVGGYEILMDVYVVTPEMIEEVVSTRPKNVTFRSGHGIDRRSYPTSEGDDFGYNIIVSDELHIPVMLNMDASLNDLHFIYTLRCSDVGHTISSELLEIFYNRYITPVALSLQEYINPSKQLHVDFVPFYMYGRAADTLAISVVFIPQGFDGVPILKTNPLSITSGYNEFIYPFIEEAHSELPEDTQLSAPNIFDLVPYLYSSSECVPYVFGYKEITPYMAGPNQMKVADVNMITKFILYITKGSEMKAPEWTNDKKYGKTIIPFFEFCDISSTFSVKEMELELPIKLFKRKKSNRVIEFFKRMKFPTFVGRVQSGDERVNVTHDVIELALKGQPSIPSGEVIVHYVDEKYTHFVILGDEKTGNISSPREEKKGKKKCNTQ